LAFCNEETENNYQKVQAKRGRSTSIYALISLFVLNLIFAFLEFWILGLNSMVPMVAYLVVAVISIAVVFFSLGSDSSAFVSLRTLVPGILTLMVLLLAVILQQYRIYHAIEISLLIIWLGSLNILSLRRSILLSFMSMAIFSATAYFFGATDLKLTGLLSLQLAAFSIAIYLSFMLERFRRMMFLTNEALQKVYSRQESWAYTLIDLDMALSGIRDFKEMIGRLVEYINPVIAHDSFVFTALEGKGPKPSPDALEGTLFELEDKTYWTDEVMTRLSQTRQAYTSSEYEMVRGFLWRKKQDFLHFRMDIPVMNDSALVGVSDICDDF